MKIPDLAVFDRTRHAAALLIAGEAAAGADLFVARRSDWRCVAITEPEAPCRLVRRQGLILG